MADHPVRPDKVRAHIRKIIADVEANPPDIDAAARSRLIFVVREHMIAVCDQDNVRKRVMGWLLRNDQEISTGSLTDAELIAFKRWIGPWEKNGRWVTRDQFPQEFEWCIWAAYSEYDQPVIECAKDLGGVVTEIANEQPEPIENKPYIFD